ncbi:HYC_CC_PP family protein [Prolixibacter denitrificans]|uniref:Uncharacterized protein n=1 Tax=Prolixibacter denitrificans TaxID=1541063 RepID=A0A2P8CBM6_9BACT|nr:hypothetical protein [Prolixibacter denitrificans]PSK82367.1 hypothetical protein CLV93_106111 [Prolixibacter denitrificans]
MIRKTGHILTALILLASTIGVTINKHYSNGQLFDVSVYTAAQSCCSPGHHMDGCHDTHEHYQVVNDFLASNFDNDFQAPVMNFIAPVMVVPAFELPVIAEVNTPFHTHRYRLPAYDAGDRCALMQVFLC